MGGEAVEFGEVSGEKVAFCDFLGDDFGGVEDVGMVAPEELAGGDAGEARTIDGTHDGLSIVGKGRFTGVTFDLID